MTLLQDLKFALRLLVKDRWFTAVAAVALALGIGVNATVFTFVNAVLIRGLPFDDPDRIMSIGTRDARGRDRGLSYLEFQDWRTGQPQLHRHGGVQRTDDERERRGTGAGTFRRPVHLGECVRVDRREARARPRFSS